MFAGVFAVTYFVLGHDEAMKLLFRAFQAVRKGIQDSIPDAVNGYLNILNTSPTPKFTAQNVKDCDFLIAHSYRTFVLPKCFVNELQGKIVFTIGSPLPQNSALYTGVD